MVALQAEEQVQRHEKLLEGKKLSSYSKKAKEEKEQHKQQLQVKFEEDWSASLWRQGGRAQPKR